MFFYVSSLKTWTLLDVMELGLKVLAPGEHYYGMDAGSSFMSWSIHSVASWQRWTGRRVKIRTCLCSPYNLVTVTVSSLMISIQCVLSVSAVARPHQIRWSCVKEVWWTGMITYPRDHGPTWSRMITHHHMIPCPHDHVPQKTRQQHIQNRRGYRAAAQHYLTSISRREPDRTYDKYFHCLDYQPPETAVILTLLFPFFFAGLQFDNTSIRETVYWGTSH